MSKKDISQLLEQFKSISLNEMDDVQLMNRMDTKFSFNVSLLKDFLPVLKDSYDILKVEEQLISDYESVYFDDEDFSAFYDHQRKRLNRFKVRYRKYVSSNISFLEVKHKVKGRTEKSRMPVDFIPEEMTNKQASFVKYSGVKGELKPSLKNNFSRITLVNKDKTERVTLDLNITFSWKNKTKKLKRIVIAELKQEKAMRSSPFYSLMKQNQIRPLKLSKYCIGIIKIYGKINTKYNRFKQKLLIIKKIQTDAA